MTDPSENGSVPDPLREQLSACLDGELPEGELDLLLKRLSRPSATDPASGSHLTRSLGRYALIGEALRSTRPAIAPATFAGRVAAAVMAEPATERPARLPLVVGRQAVGRWLRPAAGVAVAAGVAAVAVLALQPQTRPELVAQGGVTPVPSSAALDNPSYIVPAMTANGGFVPATKLTNYVVAHSEYSSPLGRRLVLSGVLSGDQDEDRAAEPDGDTTPIDVTFESPAPVPQP